AKLSVLALASALTIPAIAADRSLPAYGRAGGTVGTDRVQEVGGKSETRYAAADAAFDVGYGRSGGPAQLAVAKAQPATREGGRTVTWYGRAGYPLYAGGADRYGG
ncbi:MAG TPA: hypothetical protein VFA81_13100, partial [Burkholderiales bacterium]|nr:hypothetical protein [Burkholderiales bacterium]